MDPTRFVGRDAELAELWGLLDAAREGRFVLLLGEAGMGKSALVNALVPDARGVVRLPAPPAQQRPTWRSWSLDLRRAGAHLERSTVSAVAPEDHADTILELWRSIPVPRRPLLVVEDVHWADEETLRLLERLAGPGIAGGLRLLATSRPHGAASQRLLAAVRSRGGTILDLGPWSEDEAASYARQVLGVDDLDPTLAARLRGAAGWPLLVDGLAAAWRRDPTSALSGPGRLHELVAEQLATMPASAYDVMVRAALLGTEPDSEVLASSYADRTRIAPALRAAVDVGLLVEDGVAGRVAFRHDLVRDAVLAQTLDLERREHAAALLELLESPAEWSWRWRQVSELAIVVDRVDLAIEARLSGAAAALDSGSPLLAGELADEAAALARGPAKVRCLALSVRAHALVGDVAGALEASASFEAAEAVDPDPALATAMREARARTLGASGRWKEALDLLDGATASPVRAMALLETGDTDRALAAAEQVLAGTSDPAVRCEAMEVAGRAARARDLDAAHRWFARAAAQAESARLPFWRARALHELATISQVRHLEVSPLYEARAAAVEAGAVALVSSVDFHIAAVHGVRFEPEPALVAARRLLADSRRLGLPPHEAWAWILIGQAHAVAGRRAQAEQAAGDAAALAGDRAELQGMSCGIGALAALLDDDLPAALRLWTEAVRLLRSTPAVSPLPPWYLWPVLATVHDLDGDSGAAARAEVTGSDLATFAGVAGLCRVADAVALGRGGDVDAAMVAWRTGSVLVAEVPSFVGWLHLAHRVAAASAHRDGWGEPATWMVDAEAWFAERGLRRLVAACRSVGRSVGVPQRRRGRGMAEVPVHLRRLSVTSREMDVLLLVAEGRTNAEVAELLVLSPGTVKSYVERLLSKTGAANRTALAALLTAR